VEAKVNDPVKGFQLQRYRDNPELIESRAIIVSLARIGAHDKLIAKDDLCPFGRPFSPLAGGSSKVAAESGGGSCILRLINSSYSAIASS